MTFTKRLNAHHNVIINYATKEFRKSQHLNRESAKTVGKVANCITFSPRDVDPLFRRKNREILDTPRGGGLWLWKPYIILLTLKRLRDGDILFYCDSGAIFTSSAEPLFNLARLNKTLICFDVGLPEIEWTKQDVFHYMHATQSTITDTNQRLAGFQLWYRSRAMIDLAEEYLQYCQNINLISDNKSTCGIPENPRFRENRHDQSIFSVLTKKHDIPCYRDPSTEPRPSDLQQGNANSYPKILHLTRLRHDQVQQPLKSKFSTLIIDLLRKTHLSWRFRRLT